MRGHDRPQATMLTLVSPEKRVPANHPIRRIKLLAERALCSASKLYLDRQACAKLHWSERGLQLSIVEFGARSRQPEMPSSDRRLYFTR